MKKSEYYQPPGFRFEVWNDNVKLTFKTDGKVHTRSELLDSWAKINEQCLNILAGVREPETPNSPDVGLQKKA